ncbi:TonB C-terminal domain-containing protein [Pseudomonas aeruginosa]|uniref:TonB C-terminal domain-containing protein n=1 Tax=Pseudomonas aeruginosa TaxID=287 RepID=UPI003CFF444A
MNESKLTYIALALGAGALAVSVASAVLSALPNSNKIASLSTEVADLRKQNVSLTEQLEIANQNRSRIDELDIGLTAMANVMNIDRQQLAKAMMAMKTADAQNAQAQLKSAASPKAAQPSSVTQQLPPARSAAPVSPVDSPAPGVPVVPVVPVGASSGKQPVVAQDLALEVDNPFAGASDASIHAGGEIPAPIAVVPAGAPKLTIEHVDSILAKRISEKWYKPAGAAANLNALIQMKMTREGKVDSVVLTRPSGNAEFDSSVISAVKSIGAIDEVQRLSDADFDKAYANRIIQFTPQMGG